jgi:acetyl-CoA carboxylase carboxyl transferase subunit beta
MPWFRKTRKPKQRPRQRSPVPEGLWVRCDGCREIIYARELERNLRICPKCGHHFRIDVETRLDLLLDGPGRRLFEEVRPTDPLGFVDTTAYGERLSRYQEKLGTGDALAVVEGQLDGRPVILAVMDYRFMGGSMGSVVGERLVRAIERAEETGVPLVVVSASGGARMQEGALSLMQMAKIAAALARLREAGVPYLSVLTDPTTGGVTASFAMLGDLNVAEPGALIGFAGPRVIEQTIRETLPEGFQRSEFLLEHGFLDMVVPRTELKETLSRCLGHLV